ncbi:MAG TPA: HRDC domain-containing protein, partial [Thiolinea sp.]|nr:HRDC domain-containing protein [Thiolinea sp.]
LTHQQLDYAIDDVRYLRQIYPILKQRLQETGRLNWLNKPFERLTEASEYTPDPWMCWERVKGVQLLKPKQLAVLRELTAWREELAIQKDLPRRWLLTDEVLVDMARMKNRDLNDFADIRGLSAEQIARYGQVWLDLIRRAQALPAEEWPDLPRRRKLDADLSLVADLLMVVVNQQALAHNISAAMLASRAQIEKMLTDGRTQLSDDWRGSLVNDLFARILSGKACIRVQQQTLKIED